MIYHHAQVQVKPGKRVEFNDFWVNESLPLWEKYGAKHIGSFITSIGSTTNNDIIRLFAWPSLREVEEMRSYMLLDPQGRRVVERLREWVDSVHEQILLPAKGSPLQ